MTGPSVSNIPLGVGDQSQQPFLVRAPGRGSFVERTLVATGPEGPDTLLVDQDTTARRGQTASIPKTR
jgi:hypothetical protein